MRKKVIAANWKLNKTLREAVDFVTQLKRENFGDDHPEIIVCPVFTALAEVSELTMESPIGIGGQDLYWEEKGAFTGEVSGALLKDAGCEYVIIGHSERRQFFHETDETVNQKFKSAISSELKSIICCGEKLEERESGKTLEVINRQIRGAFEEIKAEDAQKTLIAYEPVWAIGTGQVATPQQAEEAHHYIRGLIKTLYSDEVAEAVPILYGGSVKPENAEEILKQTNVDGALVGGASLDPGSFIQIIRHAQAIKV